MKRYNIAISWNSLEDCYFANIIKKLCKKKKLSFLWIYDGNSKETLRGLYNQKMRIDILIDTDATYNDPEDLYSRICYAVKDSEGMVINDPDDTQAGINKALMYHKLVALKMPTPHTIVVRKWQPKKVFLTKSQKTRLGIPFIIKPAQGYGQKGIIRQATGTPYCIAKARAFDPNDDFLLQRRVKPVFFNGKKGWFRVFRIFDIILPCWWDDKTNRYEHISEYEFKKYKLTPLFDITVKIAQATGMVWFSTEIAIVKDKKGISRYMPIDYVNDQCDMTPVSQTPSGIPNHVAIFTANTLIKNSVKLLKDNHAKSENYRLHFR
ncbi:hypothetical protein D4R86_02415 [bacterium]|nr:MAG: hypothetical protein D4R86_02415 [bacterium]